MVDHYYSQQVEAHGGHDEGHSGMHPLPAQSRDMKEIDKAFEVGVDELGTTTNPFEHQTQALKARIFHGASRIEFSFFGAQKGRKEQPTPETFGKRERLDMRELAEFNEVETTTHATVSVQGLSGLNMQQGNFSDDQRKQSMDEIKESNPLSQQKPRLVEQSSSYRRSSKVHARKMDQWRWQVPVRDVS
jgi:hypothetical protein